MPLRAQARVLRSAIAQHLWTVGLAEYSVRAAMAKVRAHVAARTKLPNRIAEPQAGHAAQGAACRHHPTYPPASGRGSDDPVSLSGQEPQVLISLAEQASALGFSRRAHPVDERRQAASHSTQRPAPMLPLLPVEGQTRQKGRARFFVFLSIGDGKRSWRITPHPALEQSDAFRDEQKFSRGFFLHRCIGRETYISQCWSSRQDRSG